LAENLAAEERLKPRSYAHLMKSDPCKPMPLAGKSGQLSVGGGFGLFPLLAGLQSAFSDAGPKAI
jgi:hypothetical protein